MLLPEVPQGDALGVAQPLLADGEAARARAEEEALLDLGVPAAKLMHDDLVVAAHLERIVRRERKRAAWHNLWNRDVAEVVRQVRPAPS